MHCYPGGNSLICDNLAERPWLNSPSLEIFASGDQEHDGENHRHSWPKLLEPHGLLTDS